ncbi:hypothetical protein DSECCO2_68100 [anaerobic digester metagenome]
MNYSQLSLLSLHSSIPSLFSPRLSSRFNHLYTPTNFYSAVRDHGRGQRKWQISHRRERMKTAVRELTAPIDSMAAFTSIEGDILTNNPWGYTSLRGLESPFQESRRHPSPIPAGSSTIIKRPSPSGPSVLRLQRRRFITDVSNIVATTALNTAN